MSYQNLYLQESGKIMKLVESDKPNAKLFGVPFDSTSSFRVGSKFAPHEIRVAFNNLEIYSRIFDVNLEKYYIEDLGDVSASCDARVVSKQVSNLWKELITKEVPICMLGGEHSISYGSISALPEDVGIVVFDAHLDLREELNGSDFTHATFLRRILEIVDRRRFIHVGSRAACAQEWEYVKEKDLRIIEQDCYKATVLSKNNFFRKYKNIYVSVDMDVFDPAFAPGIGNPEPCGLSPKDFLDFLRNLRGNRIVGFDIVEVCPPYDNGNTSILAAKLILEILSYCHLIKH